VGYFNHHLNIATLAWALLAIALLASPIAIWKFSSQPDNASDTPVSDASTSSEVITAPIPT